MMRRCVLWCVVVVLAIAGRDAIASSPNVIVVMVDDMGWRDLSCQGSTFYETPHIDRLAAGGLRFTNGYAACTVCSPSRAAMMTGQYPARLHITDWIPGHDRPFAKLRIPDWQKFLPLKTVTVAERLQAAVPRFFSRATTVGSPTSPTMPRSARGKALPIRGACVCRSSCPGRA